MKKEGSKNSTYKKSFYFTILKQLSLTTNLTEIQEKLSISKQSLNYYLRRMKKLGLVKNTSRGLWEVVKNSKNSTKYGSLLKKDSSRGHGYILNIKIPKIPENWDKRIELLKRKDINYKLVGAKETTPRIKVLGRKVWLCNSHLRIFDKKDQSYYGDSAIESKKKVFLEFIRIIKAVENKLNINLQPYDFQWKKEHYALIKNDLAIYHNRKGIILRVKDNEGEWLLIDDSLEMGGELETIGKNSLVNNLKLQKWWNENKEGNFKWSSKQIEQYKNYTDNKIKELSRQNMELTQLLEQISNNMIRNASISIKLNERLDKAGL